MKKIIFAVVFVFLLLLIDYRTVVKADEIQEEIKLCETDINDKEIVSLWTTEELINKIVDKEIYKLFLFSDLEKAITIFKQNNPYYLILKDKSDVESCINCLLKQETKHTRIEKIKMLQNIVRDVDINGYLYSQSQMFDVFTPNGSVVQYAYRMFAYPFPETVLSQLHSEIVNDYPELNVSYYYPATFDFNCHSYAWYSQNCSTNQRWINYPNNYFWDYSYEEVTDVRPGDIFCYVAGILSYDNNNQPYYQYYISHSAIVVDFTDDFDLQDVSSYQYINLISKWGAYGLYGHTADRCYYITSEYGFQYATVFRPRVIDNATLSNPVTNTTITITKTLSVPENASIMQNYALYQLNVSSSLDYVFSVSSNSMPYMKLYDIHMQQLTTSLTSEYDGDVYTKSFSKYLSPGMYYLRVCYTNSNSYGIITTTINCQHYHNFNSYVWRDLTFHDEMCTLCGPNPATHVVSINDFNTKKPPKLYTCMICGGPASAYTPFYGKNDLLPHTINGSLMLPNGIIVLADEDWHAYLEGKLVFITDDIKKENIVSYLEKKKQLLEYL